MITNRNIAADADIDLSKLNLISGQRTFWEDFDADPATAINDLYGFSTAVASGGTATCANTSLGLLNGPTNNDKALAFVSARWHGNRGCKMSARVTTVSSLAAINVQIGWGDDAAMVIDGPVDDQDWALFEFRAGTADGQWRLGSRITGAAAVFVNTGITVASATIYNISVELTTTGTVIGKINDDTFQSAAGAVKTGATDWHPFARISVSAAGGKLLAFDTFSASESRTDI